MITTPEGIVKLVEALKGETYVAVDTEFIREKTFFPQIALMQFATREQTWLVDPVAVSKADMAPLIEVLRDSKITKIMHAAFADQECLYWSYDCIAEPVFDTSVGAALLGMGDNVGLGRLTQQLLDIKLPKGLARAKWLARPLSDELLRYAVMDVAHLVEMGEILIERLKKRGRYDWSVEESRVDSKAFDTPPEDIAARISKSGNLDGKTCAVLLELVRWREARAKRADLPRNWISDNETLRALAKVKPKNEGQLGAFRGLKKGELKYQADQILGAIERGLNTEPVHWKKGKSLPIPSDEENRATDLLKAYVNYLCTQQEIAPRFVLTGSKFYRLLCFGSASPESWVKEGILSMRASELLAKDLQAFLSGSRGLALRDKKVRVLPVGADTE